jgi:hypothetical protein
MSREDETRPDKPPFAFEDICPEDKPFPLTDADRSASAVSARISREKYSRIQLPLLSHTRMRRIIVFP